MTRRSKREVARALENLGDGTTAGGELAYRFEVDPADDSEASGWFERRPSGEYVRLDESPTGVEFDEFTYTIDWGESP